jgi:putative sigma-54 modulation protein
MRIHFTGRHVEVTPALEAFARERIEKLARFVPALLEAHVVLSVEKYRHRAEVSVHSRRSDLLGVQESGDMYTSLSQVFEKLERQARKDKEKLSARNRRGAAPAGEAAAAAPLRPVRRRAPAGARRAARPSPRVVPTPPDELKPMSVEDAVLAMQDSGDGFLVFRNARSQRVNVVYRRGDGRFGVIEA